MGGKAKAGLNYGSMMRAKAEVQSSKRAADILCFDAEGYVEEYSSASPFFVEEQDGQLVLVTSRVTRDEREEETGLVRNNLDSITRRTIITLAEKLGIKVEKRNIHAGDIPNMIGAFRAGSAAGITRVAEINVRKDLEDQGTQCNFDDTRATELIQQLQRHLAQARRGELEGDLATLNEEWVTRIPVGSDQLMPK